MTGPEDARLLKWLRRQVNGDLRKFRATDPGQAEVCKAILELIRWAESWQHVRDPGYTANARVNAEMVADLDLIIDAVRRLAAGYRDRDGWRKEWEVQR